MEAAYDAGLAEHNRLRALHKNTPPMVQGLKVTIAAQAWADKLVNDWKGPGYSILHHAPNSARPGQGENIAYNFEVDAAKACVAATKAWYDEIKDYNYASPGFGYNTGHFTQVLLRNYHKILLLESRLCGKTPPNSAWASVNSQMAHGLLSVDTLVNLDQFKATCLVDSQKMFFHFHHRSMNRKYSQIRQNLGPYVLTTFKSNFQTRLSKIK